MTTFWTSSIGQKVIMAITGIALFLFIFAHMLGNLQIFAGPNAINHYAEFLKGLGNGLWFARLGILSMFVLHIISAYKLTLENQKARPERYILKQNIKSSWTSNYMGVLGTLILFYVIFHLLHFTFHYIDPSFATVQDSHGRPDVYSMIVKGFNHPAISFGYMFAMLILGAHLWHGIPSFFQTLGFRHPVLTPLIEKLSPIIATLITLGYLSIPLAVLLKVITLPTGGM